MYTELIYICSLPVRSVPLAADADDRDADDFAYIVKRAELIPQRQRRRIGGAQIADRLRHPVVAGISQRRKQHRRRVRKKADNTQQPQLLQQ